ncbi:MAG TPA: DMT family transporter, partial [Alphaproteobacteria bacterium]
REEIQRGIVYVLLAVFTFSAVNALIKWLSAVYPVTELVFFRSLFALAPTFVLVATHGAISQMRTRRFGEHLARAIIQFLSMMSIFTAFSMMPLADAIAITFAAPLFMTVLSIPLLGERVGIHRWGAVVVGFAGVLLMVQPGPGVLESGAVFALMNAFLSASVTIALRRMSVTESSTTLVFYQIVIPAGLSTLLLPFGWVTPTWTDAGVMALSGILAGVGQYWWTQAFRLAPASVAAPFSYTSMIWAVAFGYLIWGDVPTLLLFAGALIVTASGLYILYRETVRHAERPPKPPAAPTQS